jgi:hypothetical protein
MRTYTKWAAVAALGCVLPFAVQATPITGNDATLLNAIGYIQPGVDASSSTGESQVNSLLEWVSGTISDPSDDDFKFVTVAGGIYNETAVYFGPGGSSGNVDLGAGGYAFLAVKYDGAQGTLQVWDVSGLTGSVTVAGQDENGKTPNVSYLFNAVQSHNIQIPDGGTTIALLGFALAGVGFLRRKLGRC